jgi:hypothetical protein
MTFCHVIWSYWMLLIDKASQWQECTGCIQSMRSFRPSALVASLASLASCIGPCKAWNVDKQSLKGFFRRPVKGECMEKNKKCGKCKKCIFQRENRALNLILSATEFSSDSEASEKHFICLIWGRRFLCFWLALRHQGWCQNIAQSTPKLFENNNLIFDPSDFFGTCPKHVQQLHLISHTERFFIQIFSSLPQGW